MDVPMRRAGYLRLSFELLNCKVLHCALSPSLQYNFERFRLLWGSFGLVETPEERPR